MAYLHAIPAGNLGWAMHSILLLAGILADGSLAVVFRRGFGRRGFGRGLGPFRMFRLVRILFVLLFTTVLGPIVLVVVLVFAGYWFYTNRRG